MMSFNCKLTDCSRHVMNTVLTMSSTFISTLSSWYRKHSVDVGAVNGRVGRWCLRFNTGSVGCFVARNVKYQCIHE
jgi:hypothetical protein